jgi:hypothetical protein
MNPAETCEERTTVMSTHKRPRATDWITELNGPLEKRLCHDSWDRDDQEQQSWQAGLDIRNDSQLDQTSIPIFTPAMDRFLYKSSGFQRGTICDQNEFDNDFYDLNEQLMYPSVEAQNVDSQQVDSYPSIFDEALIKNRSLTVSMPESPSEVTESRNVCFGMVCDIATFSPCHV